LISVWRRYFGAELAKAFADWRAAKRGAADAGAHD
jgi:hypothetical protein